MGLRFSRLNELGIAAPCEGDIPGTINMLVLNSMNGEKAMINDLVCLDEDDTSINMWHCGVAPGSCADKAGVCWDEHFNIEEYNGSDWHGSGVVASMAFKPGKVTIARINNSFSDLFVMTGEVMEDKEPYYGSSGWVNNLKMEDESLSIPDLINTIVVNKVDHHYPMTYGDLTNELIEFANWKKINILKPRPYKIYKQNF